MPKRYFDTLLQTFGNDCEILTVTSPDGRALSSVLSFYFRDEVLPYYAGDDEAARDLAANDFKYWELMRRSCESGLRIFDYGRSKVGTGPYAFKKNWGFEPRALHYEYCLYKRDSIPRTTRTTPSTNCSLKPGGACQSAWPIGWARTSCAISVDHGQRPLPRPPPALPAKQG